MPRQAIALVSTSLFALILSACDAHPSDPVPTPEVPPTTPAAAAVETTAAIQSGSLSPQGQPLKKPVTCREEIGDDAAQALVRRCIAVSPATRPPCNVANPCQMIEDEIKRGCDFFGPNEKPAECTS
ncbi:MULTISPECIES: hypothetical protein [unclassified Brevundimonas]|uniref:hypothetical protein n=1 Tax=unclassified Brevundimonas TaxID=2622653 RepID=UPI0025C1425B|nr:MULTISPECIES: hypothetical protein [unclassified Brevundimonas]